MSRCLLILLALLAGPAHAGLMNIRFEVKQLLCGSVFAEDLPSRSYVFTVDLDRQGERHDPHGSTYVMQDGRDLELFHADLAEGNHVKSSSLDPAKPSYNFGLWFNHPGQNVWCSPQVGVFNYTTIATLGVGHQDDQVTAFGMWATNVPFTGVESFLTPGALWQISDNGASADAPGRYNLYSAELISIEAVVPTVGSLALCLPAFAALAWARRRRTPV